MRVSLSPVSTETTTGSVSLKTPLSSVDTLQDWVGVRNGSKLAWTPCSAVAVAQQLRIANCGTADRHRVVEIFRAQHTRIHRWICIRVYDCYLIEEFRHESLASVIILPAETKSNKFEAKEGVVLSIFSSLPKRARERESGQRLSLSFGFGRCSINNDRGLKHNSTTHEKRTCTSVAMKGLRVEVERRYQARCPL